MLFRAALFRQERGPREGEPAARTGEEREGEERGGEEERQRVEDRLVVEELDEPADREEPGAEPEVVGAPDDEPGRGDPGGERLPLLPGGRGEGERRDR